MNTCFNGLVGIRGGCGTDNAPFLLDTIGISYKILGYAKDERFLNHVDYFTKMHDLAWQTVLNDVSVNGIGFDNMKVLYDPKDGFFEDEYTSTVDPINLSLTDKCKYSALLVNKISIYLTAANASTISVNGTVVFTAARVYTQEVVEIFLNQTYDSLELTFSVGVTEIGIVENKDNPYVTIENNAIISYFVVCTNEKILCKFAKVIAPAVLVKLAALIWHDIYISGRWNEFVELKRETAVPEMARLDSTYNYLAYDVNNHNKDGEYQRILKTIKISSSEKICPCCQSCKGKTEYVYAIP